MQLLVFILVFPILWLISCLPHRLFYAFSDFVCFLVYRVVGYRRRLVRSNLMTSFPEKSLQEIIKIEKEFYQHFCDIMLEMLKTFQFSEEEMKKRMVFTNLEVLNPFFQDKKSFIIMCGHYASYEWLLSLALYLPCQAYAVYTPISNRYFDRLIQKSRSRFKSFLVSRYKIQDKLKEYLLKDSVIALGLASDQSPSNSKKQYFRDFLGVKVPVFTGAERIAKQFDLPVIFAEIERVKRGYYQTEFKIITQNPLQESSYKITDIFTELLENQIRKNPKHYLWTHNRFKHRIN